VLNGTLCLVLLLLSTRARAPPPGGDCGLQVPVLSCASLCM
jgi:hypothetical protein